MFRPSFVSSIEDIIDLLREIQENVEEQKDYIKDLEAENERLDNIISEIGCDS